MHQLTVKEEQATQVLFACVHCQREIGFVKPGHGEPSAALQDGQWQAPANPEQWMGECDAVS